MKNKMTRALAILITLLVPLVGAGAQSLITGKVLGNDGEPLKKCLVLMAIGGSEEKTITIKTLRTAAFTIKPILKDYIF